MEKIEKVVSDLEQQIRWIEEIECHKFPGWLNVTNAIRDALELLKEQKKLLELQHSAMRGSADMVELLFKKLDEIVFCKDCKYRGNNLCPFYQKYQGEKYDDWFCADGKLKD